VRHDRCSDDRAPLSVGYAEYAGTLDYTLFSSSFSLSIFSLASFSAAVSNTSQFPPRLETAH
jgi:hypothetical protein